jgi:hypothetical protein
MKTSHRRIALLTGASLTALGTATPAFAAPHDATTLATGMHSGTSHTFAAVPAVDTIDICSIADNPACFLGDLEVGTGAVSATVNSVASGQIVQSAAAPTGAVDFVIGVAAGDSAEIGAVALATASAAGFATADANNYSAISQYVTGATDDVDQTVVNGGSLLIDALAVATATTGSASASASK